MKKNKKQGFVLAETISISVVVMIALVAIYTQFTMVMNGFYKSFKYNSVNNLYLVDNIRKFVIEDGLDKISPLVIKNDYVDITNCQAEYFTETLYCKNLMDSASVKQVIITQKDVNSLKQKLDSVNFSGDIKNFIRALNTNDNDRLRIIVLFKNDEVANLYI